MSAPSIDDIVTNLLRAGIIPAHAVLDGSLSVVDVSRRNRNYRASWSDSGTDRTGIVIKYPDPVAPRSTETLRNESSFYAACLRTRGTERIAIPELRAEVACAPALALELVRNAVTLDNYRAGHPDSANAYAAFGKALASFHRFAASPRFRADSYALGLPSDPPGILSVHKPSLAELRHLSPAQIGFLRIVQRETNLGTFFERLSAELQPTTVVHTDLKGDNVLVQADGDTPEVTLVDWELAQRGDPAWDIGTVFQDLLASWLMSVRPSAEKDMTAQLNEAKEPLRLIQPSFRAFWGGYVGAASLPIAARDDVLSRAVDCSAAVFVRRAHELASGADIVPNHTVTMIQLAANLASSPAKGSLLLYGLPSDRRRDVGRPRRPA